MITFIYHIERKKRIGGIFFDYETNNWDKNFKFVRAYLLFIRISKDIEKKLKQSGIVKIR